VALSRQALLPSCNIAILRYIERHRYRWLLQDVAWQKTRWISLDRHQRAAECLKTIAHPHRLRMIQMLLEDRFTVGELAEACEIPSHMASEHLKLMERYGFLQSQRAGRNVYYEVVEVHLKNIMTCIESRF
jgi:ArsR family transcriptional regulator, zinc-responsive transcriptional repressor